MRTRALLPPGVLVALVVWAGCGGKSSEPLSDVGGSDPGPVHVHGLGIDPADGSLFVATHTGLLRTVAGASRAERVADRFQDTMGFTVVGRNRRLGSGHPDGREALPPFLGLIESRDAGHSWRPISLPGEVDFHVLEADGERIYGYGSDRVFGADLVRDGAVRRRGMDAARRGVRGVLRTVLAPVGL